MIGPAESSRGIESVDSNISDQPGSPAPAISPSQRTVAWSEPASPLIHIPLYCAHDATDHGVQYLIELHLACLDSYFVHQNTYDVLVTTNDGRVLAVLLVYKEKSRHPFELRLVSRYELLSTFRTDESRLSDSPCMKTIFSKFYPILKQECAAIVHVDFDTLFMSKIDLAPLMTSDIGLIDANQFDCPGLWYPTARQANFFRIDQPVEPVSSWINSGVFSVQRGGFDLCRTEVAHYLENLERAITDGINAHTDELILNALAVRRRDAVTVIADYRYNFLAYFLKYDPSWTWRSHIIHFHSLKPYMYWYVDGFVQPRCDATEAERINDDFYLAVLMWCRHLHTACRQLPFNLPMLSAMPLEVVEKELARLLAERDDTNVFANSAVRQT